MRGRVEFPNDTLEDVVLVRGDGRPTYNFASPMEDVWDEITHVIRAEDHISNTPKQINIIQAIGAELPVYAHVPNVNGADGKKLSKRHGATGVDEFRKAGYLPDALVNFLALLGWAPDGETTIMSRDELIERFTLERVTPSPAQFDYAKLDWLNGMYIRALPVEEFAHALILWLGEQGYDWDAVVVRKAAPLVQEKLARLDEFPAYARFLFEDVQPDPAELDGGAPVIAAARDALAELEPFTAEAIEAALRAVLEQLGLKPRQGFQPIRVAVTGSKISPGLFESIELLGRERDAGAAQCCRGCLIGSGFGAASGSSARWKSRQARRRNCIDGVGSSSSRFVVSPRPTSLLVCARLSHRLWGQRRRCRWGYGLPVHCCLVATDDNRQVVLVIDDEPAIRLLCRVNLELGGYEVREAGTARRGAGMHGRGRRRRAARHAHRQRARRGPARRARRAVESRSRSSPGSTDLEAISRRRVPHAVLGKPFTIDELESTVARLAALRASRR